MHIVQQLCYLSCIKFSLEIHPATWLCIYSYPSYGLVGSLLLTSALITTPYFPTNIYT